MFAYIFGLFLVAWEMLCCKLLVETFAEKKRYKHELIPAVILRLRVYQSVITI